MAKKTGTRYVLSGTVERRVQDDITVAVWARSPKAAIDKVTRFLSQFPGAASTVDVDYAYIENRDTLDTEVLDLEIIRKG